MAPKSHTGNSGAGRRKETSSLIRRRIVSFTNCSASVPALVASCASCVSCSGVKCTSIPSRYGKTGGEATPETEAPENPSVSGSIRGAFSFNRSSYYACCKSQPFNLAPGEVVPANVIRVRAGGFRTIDEMLHFDECETRRGCLSIYFETEICTGLPPNLIELFSTIRSQCPRQTTCEE